MIRSRFFKAGFAVLVLSGVGAARADFENLFGRLPADANAIVLIDVAKIMQSPIAVKEGWKAMQADAYADKPLVVPPDAKEVVLAASFDIRSMHSAWEVSVMTLEKPVSLESIAAAEQGYMGTVAGKSMVFSPINAYFVQLDANVLAAISPADRRFAGRWLRTHGSSGGSQLSPYLGTAVSGDRGGADFILALDLEDVFEVPRVRSRIESGFFECLDNAKVDHAALAETLASLRGVTMRVKFADGATGSIVAHFNKDTAPLATVGKPLLRELLEKAGADLNDLRTWQFTAKDRTFTGQGKLSQDGLRCLFSVVEPPSPLPATAMAASVTDTAKPKDSSKPKPKPKSKPSEARVAASQKYYHTISLMLDNLGNRASSMPSLTQFATWLKRDARRVARLPILNVDPDLVKWGEEVAMRLSEGAQIYTVGGLTVQTRAAGVMDTASENRWIDTSEEHYSTNQNDVNRRNAMAMRRAASKEEQAKVAQAVSGIVNDLMAKRLEIRKVLTQRYKVEFK